MERRVIGEWPAIPSGVLWDFYGVPRDRIAFGCGLAGGSPFLIWRMRLNLENRGGYPYTLLVDPGIEVWRKFGYNAAALLQALMADEECATGLVEGIDNITLTWLDAAIGRLRPLPISPSRSDLALCWVLSAVSQSSSFVHGGVPPSLEECAGWLAGLPVCFRLGGGWLVSGCTLHARAYGTRLVFDPDFGSPVQQREEEEGELILRTWRSAERDHELGVAVRALSDVPAEGWGKPAKAVLHEIERRRLLAVHAIAEGAERGRSRQLLVEVPRLSTVG